MRLERAAARRRQASSGARVSTRLPARRGRAFRAAGNGLSARIGALPVVTLTPPLSEVLAGASRAVARVLGGASLTAALDEATSGAARPAVQDLAYATLRDYGAPQAILARLARASRFPIAPSTRCCSARCTSCGTSAARRTPSSTRRSPPAPKLGHGAARGLVNALLRNYLRRRETLEADAQRAEPARLGYPQWWIDRVRRARPQTWRSDPRRRQRTPADDPAREPPTPDRRRVPRAARRRWHRRAPASATGRCVSNGRAASTSCRGSATARSRCRMRAPSSPRLCSRSVTGCACSTRAPRPAARRRTLPSSPRCDLLAIDRDAARAPRIEANLGAPATRGDGARRRRGRARRLVGRPAVRPHPARCAVHAPPASCAATRHQVAAARSRPRGLRARAGAPARCALARARARW